MYKCVIVSDWLTCSCALLAQEKVLKASPSRSLCVYSCKYSYRTQAGQAANA